MAGLSKEINSRIIFSSNADIGLHKITQVNDTIIYQINMGNCAMYIDTNRSHVYIGFMYDDDTFHIFNLINDGVFTDDLKDKLKNIDEPQILSISINKSNRIEGTINAKSAALTKLFKEIPDFLYIKRLECIPLKNLDAAKEIIKSLNIALIERCPGFRINIDYILNFEDHSLITSFSKNEKPYQLLLCLFYANNCVSSLTIDYENETEILFSSRTNKQYVRRKFNKLLRSIIIIIGKSLGADVVSSYAVDPISAFLMLTSFNAVSKYDLGVIVDKTTTFDKIKPIMDAAPGKMIYSMVELNDVNVANAQTIFDETILQINCEPVSNATRGGKSRKSKKRRKSKKSRKSRKSKKSRKNN